MKFIGYSINKDGTGFNMSTLYREAVILLEDKFTTQDVTWYISGNECKVFNVPTYVMDSEDRYYHKADVMMKLAVIKDLMTTNKIPSTVNFEDVADIKVN